MTDTGTAGAAPTPNPTDDWPAKAADQIVNLVDQIRDKTTGPAIKAARAMVFGFLAAMLGTAALVLFIVGLVRFVNVYAPGGVWVAHGIVGLLFVGSGLFLWAKRQRPVEAE
jgi:glycerol uptake facilitator-like aquaporin